MRLRKVKNSQFIIESSPYVVKENTKIVALEIGAGKGDFLIKMATVNPNVNFLGIEKSESVLVKALNKIPKDIKNLQFMWLDAEDVEKVFVNCVTTLYLNFSDPWPKKRHQLRRLTSEKFLNKYETIFLDKNEIIMKTDQLNLFEYSIDMFKKFGYVIIDFSYDLYNSSIENMAVSEYEKKFVDMGHPIYYVKVLKK